MLWVTDVISHHIIISGYFGLRPVYKVPSSTSNQPPEHAAPPKLSRVRWVSSRSNTLCELVDVLTPRCPLLPILFCYLSYHIKILPPRSHPRFVLPGKPTVRQPHGEAMPRLTAASFNFLIELPSSITTAFGKTSSLHGTDRDAPSLSALSDYHIPSQFYSLHQSFIWTISYQSLIFHKWNFEYVLRVVRKKKFETVQRIYKCLRNAHVEKSRRLSNNDCHPSIDRTVWYVVVARNRLFSVLQVASISSCLALGPPSILLPRRVVPGRARRGLVRTIYSTHARRVIPSDISTLLLPGYVPIPIILCALLPLQTCVLSRYASKE